MNKDLKETLYRTQLLCIRSISLNLEYLEKISKLEKENILLKKKLKRGYKYGKVNN